MADPQGDAGFPWTTFSPQLTVTAIFVKSIWYVVAHPFSPFSPSPKKSSRVWHGRAHLVQLHPLQTSKD